MVDAQLPPALARRIEAYGHTAAHVSQCGLATASDDQIRRYATSTNAVIVTKDEDAHDELARGRALASRDSAKVT